MRKIKFTGYASGWGAQIKGCQDGPKYLKSSDIKNGIWSDIYHSELENTTSDTLEIIADYCNNLCTSTQTAINNGYFPVNFGGDHSMAIGTWSGVTKSLKAEEDFGLIWIDAHMDSHTPQTSESGAYHGMPLACLLGYGEKKLTSIGSNKAKLNPHHTCLIGVRSYESGEAEFLNNHGVRVFYIEEVKERGIDVVYKEALAIAKKGKHGFGISLDIDVFDPQFAPGTGSLAYNGMTREELLPALKNMLSDSQLKAFEIAEFNPHRDKNGITLELIRNIVAMV